MVVEHEVGHTIFANHRVRPHETPGRPEPEEVDNTIKGRERNMITSPSEIGSIIQYVLFLSNHPLYWFEQTRWALYWTYM